MENTDINLEHKESSAVRDSEKGFRSEAPQIGAAGQIPVEQGAGETPPIGEEHLSPCSLSLENLEGLKEKVGTLSPQVTRKNHRGAAKEQAKKAKLAEAPTGTLAAANLGPFWAVSHRLCRGGQMSYGEYHFFYSGQPAA